MCIRERTATQAEIALPTPPAVDVAAAAEMLGAAIRIQTVTYASGDPKPGADQPWIDLEAALRARYPTVFAKMTMEKVLTHAMLMTWTGTDASLPPVILMAHQDVVPIAPGSEKNWTHPPFSGAIADGYVWGRGSWDDKGNLMAQMEAVEALLASGYQPERTIYLAYGADEEVAGLRGAAHIAALLKERKVHLDMVLDEGLLITEGMFPGLRRPAPLVGVCPLDPPGAAAE